MLTINLTGSAKTGLIAHDRKFNLLSQTQRYINTLSNFTAKMKKFWVVCNLLAAFSQPIGDPYEWSGSIMELWWEGRGLSVTVKLCGAE